MEHVNSLDREFDRVVECRHLFCSSGNSKNSRKNHWKHFGWGQFSVYLQVVKVVPIAQKEPY